MNYYKVGINTNNTKTRNILRYDGTTYFVDPVYEDDFSDPVKTNNFFNITDMTQVDGKLCGGT